MTANYTYNDDRLSAIQITGGVGYTFEYDVFGRITKTKVGTQLLSERIYDATTGLMTRQNYGNGQYVSYTYDALDRVTKLVYNGDETKPVLYYYGADGQPAAVSDALSGRLTRYVYDLSGRLAEKREYTGHTLLATRLVSSVRYTYSETTGQPIAAAYTSPLGNVSMSYTYGSGYSGEMPGVIYAVRRNNASEVSYTYDELGRLKSRSYPGNITLEYTYVNDPEADVLTSTRVASMFGVSGEVLYTYDANGNITHTQNYNNTEDFAYDALGQLISHTDAGNNTYAYTYQNGNILTATKNGETYHTYGYTNAGWSDLLTSFDGGTITYDTIGNPLTYHDGKVFTWTAGRKLSTVTDGDRNYTYAYDGDGNRISKTAYGVTTDYYYIDGKLLGLKKGQDTLLFLYDETDTVYGLIYNGTPYFYDINLQGDIIGIYDQRGNLVVSYTYDIWGALLAIHSDYHAELALFNPLLYRGYYYDFETGLYYLQSRYYDPTVGRFINADSRISAVGDNVLGYNMFAYCMNNPMNMNDHTGNWPKWIKSVANWVNKNLVQPVKKLFSSSKRSTLPKHNNVVSTSTKSSHDANRRPNEGAPGSTYRAPNGDTRTYGPDGRPQYDYDHDDHGYPETHPHDENGGHSHDWDWTNPQKPRGDAYASVFATAVGVAVVAVCVIGVIIVAADDTTVMGVLDDFLFFPLCKGSEEGLVLIL